MSAQNPSLTLKCSNGSIELEIGSALLSNPGQLLEEFLEMLEGQPPQVNVNNLCVKIGRDTYKLVDDILGGLASGQRELADTLNMLENGYIGKTSNNQCDTRSRDARRYEFLVKTCYGGNRAQQFTRLITTLADRIHQGSGDCEKCGAALLLLAYYSAAATMNQSTDCRLEDVLWAGEVLRVLAGDARNMVSLCPWEGDAAAALYAVLAYCSRCLQSSSPGQISETVKVTAGNAGLKLHAKLQ